MQETFKPEGGFASRKVHKDGLEVILLAYCRDDKRKRPIFLDMLGPKNAVKALISKAMDKNNHAAESNADTVAFFIDGEREGSSNAFRLPDNNYKSFMAPMEQPEDVKRLPRNRKPVLNQGRLVYHGATSLAGDDEFYVPVYRQIEIPKTDIHGRTGDEIWQLFLRFITTPHSAEFKHYVAPIWCSDLYNIYMFISNRIRVPLHGNWMPWLFQETVGRWTYGIGDTGYLIEYISAYISPLVYEAEKKENKPLMEHGAYRILGNNFKDRWQALAARNGKRFEGIEFQKIENKIEEVPERKNAEDVDLENGEGEIFA